MKLSMMDWVLPGKTIGEKFESAARYGLKGVEVFLTEDDDLARAERELRKAREKTGLQILDVGILGPKFCAPVVDEKSLKDKLDVHKASIELTGSVEGIFTHIVPEYNAQFIDLAAMSKPTAAEEEYFMKFLTELSPFGEEHGVFLFVEVINRYENHYYRRLGEVRQLFQKVGKPNVKAVADFFHMNLEEPDVAQAIKENADCIGHVHVGENNRSFPGEAHLDFRPGFHALKEVGYDDFVTFEIQGDYIVDPDRQIPRAMEYINRLWEES